MRDDMNSAWKPWVEGERTARHSLGTTILTIFLEAECEHREDARIARHRGLPCGQNARDTNAQHAPMAEAEVERMGDRESEGIVRPFDQDGAVAFGRKSHVAVEPGARRRCMTACEDPGVRARRLDGGEA